MFLVFLEIESKPQNSPGKKYEEKSWWIVNCI
jgi:hypothetical protein